MKVQRSEGRLRRMGVVIVGFLTLTLIATRSAQAEVVTVCPDGGDFATVQPAIDAANAGDTIELCAATYPEALSIDRNLFLRGSGQAATIIGGQTLTTVVSFSPDATVTLADLTITQGADAASETVTTAGAAPYTDTFTVTNELHLTGADQVTTIINGDVNGNVVIVQANTKVYVVNVTIALPTTAPPVIAALENEEPESSTFDGACTLPLNELVPALTDLLDSLCDMDALHLAIQNRLDALPPSEAIVLAAAAYEVVFGIDTNLELQGTDQVTTIVNGDIGGNLIIVQANTTVDVTNLTISLLTDNSITPTDTLPVDVESEIQSYLLFLPILNG